MTASNTSKASNAKAAPAAASAAEAAEAKAADVKAADVPADAPVAAAAPGGDAVAAAPLDNSPQAKVDEAIAAEEKWEPDTTSRVAVVLAHPIDNPEKLRLLRAPEKPDGAGYAVGETIWLYRDEARNLINIGYVQVDPTNKDAVRRLLFPEKFRDETADATA